mgnify:CR=1 FL=1
MNQTELMVNVKGTKHFYSLVRILNSQIGRGRWTAKGRPVRKLRRLDISNSLRTKYGPESVRANPINVIFKVPKDHNEIDLALALWGD